MSRIALLLLALCLTMGTTIGCKEEPAKTGTEPAAPADTDADGATDAADEAPADPAAK